MNPGSQKRTIVTIPKELLSNLPQAQMHGDIRVIDNPEDVAEAVTTLRKSQVIGFDTETRPSFRKGMTNQVALMQLCTKSVCFLFRLNKIGLPQPLIDLLEDREIVKIGLSVHDDFHNLNKLTQLSPQNFIDLQAFVKSFRISDNSLSKIYGIVFGKRISKGQRLTNWEADPLTEAQQHYAALDAMACLDLYDYLSAGHFNPESSPYLTYPQEETQDSSGSQSSPESPAVPKK